ncbi:amidohydrolase [Pontibacter sp. HJ8]
MSVSVSKHAIPDLGTIIALRHYLHQHPEVSGNEANTAHTIRQFVKRYDPSDVIPDLGGNGIAIVFENKEKSGPTLLFRAELDALPIAETNCLPHTSIYPGIGHKCGHDGHMATLMGLASLLHSHPLPAGKVILLFQPAEEIGAGARDVLQEERFRALKPDYVFALHNLPGLPLHQVVVREQTFSAASVGLQVSLTGKESHAAEPENGLNPGEGMSELIQAFNALVNGQHTFSDLTLLTVIHARLGEVAFGTNPGFATVMATLRAFEQADLNKLKQLATDVVKAIAGKYSLKYDFEFVEEFPATTNADEAVAAVLQAAAELGLDVQQALQPFRWSEDFGHFTQAYKGALFGLGAGVQQPQLHHADYDYPDDLIATGSSLFYGIAQQFLNA